MALAPREDITEPVFGAPCGPLPRCVLYRANPHAGATPTPVVVILPGGSYQHHAPHEGAPIAERLAALGVAAVVLHYSLGPVPLAPALLAEPARVVVYLRMQAAQLGIDPRRVALLGLSAGGHLAALSTCQSVAQRAAEATPNALGLIYPVVSCTHDPHDRSVARWLGPSPTVAQRQAASVEAQIGAGFVRTYLVSAADDAKVVPNHSLRLTEACLRHRVPIEMHLLGAGGHGFGLGDAAAWDWCQRFVTWLG